MSKKQMTPQEWFKKNNGPQKARLAKYYAEHPERQQASSAASRARLRAAIFDHYGTKCVCCGETEPKFLCIDHINGGGAKHVREIGGNFYHWLKKSGYPEGFQVLCHNCNMAKGFYGSCPHQDQGEEHVD